MSQWWGRWGVLHNGRGGQRVQEQQQTGLWETSGVARDSPEALRQILRQRTGAPSPDPNQICFKLIIFFNVHTYYIPKNLMNGRHFFYIYHLLIVAVSFFKSGTSNTYWFKFIFLGSFFLFLFLQRKIYTKHKVPFWQHAHHFLMCFRKNKTDFHGKFVINYYWAAG